MKSINHNEALSIAAATVRELGVTAGEAFEIVPDATEAVEQGWVFFYNSAEYLRTGNPNAALAGNGPLFVARDGQIAWLPSAVPWDDAVGTVARPSAGEWSHHSA